MALSFSIWNCCRQSLKNARGISVKVRNWSSEAASEVTGERSVSEDERRVLKIAMIGAPNSGKSTLINQIVQRRGSMSFTWLGHGTVPLELDYTGYLDFQVFPVSKKVHTTRCRARAVFMEGNTQLVFLDTPGLVTASESQKYHLQNEFMTGGEDAINEADVIGVVHDLSNGFTKAHLDPKVLRLLYIYRPKQTFLVMNKIDTVKSKRYLLDLADLLTGGHVNKPISPASHVSEKLIAEVVKRKSYWEHFSDIFMVSALLGQGTADLRSYLMKQAKPAEWPFPEEAYTDQGPVRLIEEIVRASLLDSLPHEIPYNLSVVLEFFDIDDNDRVKACVLVGCKTPRIHRLVVGSGGERIKAITNQAEAILEDSFQKEVILKIVVSGQRAEEFKEKLPIRKKFT